MANVPQPEANAGNNVLLNAVKSTMNFPIYRGVLRAMRTVGHDAAVEYLQQFFNKPLAETHFAAVLARAAVDSPSKPLRALWEHLEEAGSIRVAVYRGDLKVAHVCKSALGWRVFYLGTGRTNGRKHYDYPSEAIKAYFGKALPIQGE